MEQKIVFSGKTNKNHNIIIRYPMASDLEVLWKYINTLSQERTFIRYQGETVSWEEEKSYLDNLLKNIEKHQVIYFEVLHDDKMIASAGVEMDHFIHQHIGVFGISVKKEFRGEGIGKILLEQILLKIPRQLPQMEILTLGVFAHNPVAIKLYESFGFKKYGELPQGVKLKESYDNHILMYKTLR